MRLWKMNIFSKNKFLIGRYSIEGEMEYLSRCWISSFGCIAMISYDPSQ